MTSNPGDICHNGSVSECDHYLKIARRDVVQPMSPVDQIIALVAAAEVW